LGLDIELLLIKDNKNLVILNWFENLNAEFDRLLIFSDFEEPMNNFFDLMLQIDVPIEAYPNLDMILEFLGTPFRAEERINHILICFHYWSTTILDVLLRYENPQLKLESIKYILSRQNIVLGKVIRTYTPLSLHIIEEKTTKIDKLHDDRLNLIGKMASSMAHEIRNPLTSIGGFLKLIRQNIVNRSQTQLLKYIDVIDDEFDVINMHITGFLSFSRNKVLEEKKIEISVSQLVNSTLFLLYPRLTSDNINLEFNDGENCIINVQKVSVQQVISNIINNAIDELITVDYKREISILYNQDENNTYILIINNGRKIPMEMRDSLFEPFITTKEDGTGLGLAICKEIMTKNNGTIDFISNDETTRFILSFSKL
jgi:two-component system, sporulation sensor kinase D